MRKRKIFGAMERTSGGGGWGGGEAMARGRALGGAGGDAAEGVRGGGLADGRMYTVGETRMEGGWAAMAGLGGGGGGGRMGEGVLPSVGRV